VNSSLHVLKHTYHRFLDEAGDTTFFGKNKTPILGTHGVSNYFILGMLTLHEPLEIVREKILALQQAIIVDPYFDQIPSIRKKENLSGYFLHAKDDIPEVRKMAFEMIKSIDATFDVVIEKKDYQIYEKKHNGNQSEFYADMLSRLIHNMIDNQPKIVLNIAHRSRCTTHNNLEKGLQKAIIIARNKNIVFNANANVVFNVQQPTGEPIINMADYYLWAIQRWVERKEDRYVNFLEDKIKSYQFDL
jgi:hypothetical protein